MISKIRIKNFRCIDNLKIETKGINLIVGKNNTGKSSLLYSILIGTRSSVSFPNILVDSFIKKGKKTSTIVIDKVTTKIKKDYIKIDLETLDKIIKNVKDEKRKIKIANSMRNIKVIKAEYSDGKNKILKYYPPKIPYEKNIPLKYYLDLILSIEKKIKKRETLKPFKKVFYYNSCSNSFIPNVITNDFLIFYEGEDMHIKDEEATILSKYIHELEIFGESENVKKVDIYSDKQGHVSIVVLYKNGRIKKIPFTWLGDGTKSLFRILLNFIRSKNGILLLEEPENHMHPEYIYLSVLNMLKYFRKFNTQIFITTHNIEIIDAFIEILSKFKKYQEEFQIIRLSNYDNKTEYEIFDYKESKIVHNKIKGDLRGL